MKKVLCLLLCLVLALAAPLSALSEPQSWLLPLTKRGDSVKSAEAVMTLHMDPEAMQAVFDWYYEMQPLMRSQIRNAGYRLAKQLNMIFDPAYARRHRND